MAVVALILAIAAMLSSLTALIYARRSAPWHKIGGSNSGSNSQSPHDV